MYAPGYLEETRALCVHRQVFDRVWAQIDEFATKPLHSVGTMVESYVKHDEVRVDQLYDAFNVLNNWHRLQEFLRMYGPWYDAWKAGYN
jgi:hypothetical protein